MRPLHNPPQAREALALPEWRSGTLIWKRSVVQPQARHGAPVLRNSGRRRCDASSASLTGGGTGFRLGLGPHAEQALGVREAPRWPRPRDGRRTREWGRAFTPRARSRAFVAGSWPACITSAWSEWPASIPPPSSYQPPRQAANPRCTDPARALLCGWRRPESRGQVLCLPRVTGEADVGQVGLLQVAAVVTDREDAGPVEVPI